ncbi:hypothetical protein ACFO4N_04265 [Camelliibacillus cellulosilyticus]|uniref:Uncharacterized protein n=1 Tax=Camelliibacillus cellulosilyticus TaxID=2174486 RepID=A0ABV9GLZ9_9BACL
MAKDLRKQIYHMREQGVDPIVLNDVVESEYEAYPGHLEDVVWDDDVLTDAEEIVVRQADGKTWNTIPDQFRSVGRRHYE